MKNVVISDAGPIFSLAVIGQLNLLDELFDEVFIPQAVWEEITRLKDSPFYPSITDFFKDKVRNIEGKNHLTFVMDFGESEAVILYQEMGATYLLIDDKKARKYAENIDVNCIGTIGLLISAKSKGNIGELKPLFQQLISNERYYSLRLLNAVLLQLGETTLVVE